MNRKPPLIGVEQSMFIRVGNKVYRYRKAVYQHPCEKDFRRYKAKRDEVVRAVAQYFVEWDQYVQEQRKLEFTPSFSSAYCAQSALKSYLGLFAQEYLDVGDRTVTYRATNRAEEYNDVRDGVELVSKNYVDGTMEKGLSTSFALDYAALHSFRYVYKVEGTIVDFGSDGEPILRDLVVAGPLLDADAAVAADRASGRTHTEQQKRQDIAREVGVTSSNLIDLTHLNLRSTTLIPR